MCMYIYRCTCIYMNAINHVDIWMFKFTSAFRTVCVYMCMYMCMYMYTHMHMYLYMLFMYICTCICIHMYICVISVFIYCYSLLSLHVYDHYMYIYFYIYTYIRIYTCLSKFRPTQSIHVYTCITTSLCVCTHFYDLCLSLCLFLCFEPYWLPYLYLQSPYRYLYVSMCVHVDVQRTYEHVFALKQQ